MELEDPEEFDQLATLVGGFANISRLALLLGFYHGYTAKEVADFLDISRAGVQNNIERMIDANLVYRPAADDAPTYALTPLGGFFAGLFDEIGDELLEALSLLAQTETEYEQELETSPLADGLSETEARKLVNTKKWADVNDRIMSILSRLQYTRTETVVDVRSDPETPFSEVFLEAVTEIEGVDPADPPAIIRELKEVLVLAEAAESSGEAFDLLRVRYQDYLISIYEEGRVKIDRIVIADETNSDPSMS